MTKFDRIKRMSEDEFVEWLENFAEAYVAFWICPVSECDFSHREADKKIQLEMLREEYREEDEEIPF